MLAARLGAEPADVTPDSEKNERSDRVERLERTDRADPASLARKRRTKVTQRTEDLTHDSHTETADLTTSEESSALLVYD